MPESAPISTSSSSDRQRPYHATSSQNAVDRRKVSHVIATSRNETVANVECKSESKPIYFKAILSRLRSEKEAVEIATAASRSPPGALECQSRSKVLSLRISNADDAKSLTSNNARGRTSRREYARDLPQLNNAPKRISRRKYARDVPQSPSAMRDLLPSPSAMQDLLPSSSAMHNLLPSSSTPHRSSGSHESPLGQDFKTRIKQFHVDRIAAPSYLLSPYASRIRHQYFDFAKSPSTTLSPLPPVTHSGEQMEQSRSDAPLVNATEGERFESELIRKSNDTSGENIIVELTESERQSFARPESPVTTKIILRPLAKAKAGQNGVAISSPISTAFVKRGDYVEIEYFPEATADVGEGGVAVSRPELVIHFIDRRRKK